MMIGLVFLVISIVFAVLSGLAGYNIYKTQNSTAALREYHDLQVDQFREKLEKSINQLIFVNPADRQHFMFEELADMQKDLDGLDIKDDKYDVSSALASATMQIIDNNDLEALKSLELLKKRTVHSDPFVFSRAATLHAILLVRPTRTCENPAVKSLAEEAVKRDSGLAAAFNILGLCLTEEAVAMAKSHSEEDWLKANRKLQEAFMYYDLSYTLQPSAWAHSKSLNNKVWGNLVFFEAALGNEAKTKELLTLNGYTDFEHFVNDSLKHLALCKLISPNHPVWSETEAELHGLRTAYYDLNNQPGPAAAATVEMKKQYRGAIMEGLFSSRRRRQEAIDYFKSDRLLEKLHNDSEILQMIEKSVSTGM